MSSCVQTDARGRRIVVQTTAGTAGLELGTRFVMVGDEFPCGERGIQWTGARSGRRNTVTAPRKTNRDALPLDA